MNFYVPGFGMDDDPKRSAMAEEDLMELLWQNGQVVGNSHNQRTDSKLPPPSSSNQPTVKEVHDNYLQQQQQQQHQEQPSDHLFIREDEMGSWLLPPLGESHFDSDFSSDFMYNAPCVTTDLGPGAPEKEPTVAATETAASRPLKRIEKKTEVNARVQNFSHLLKLKGSAATESRANPKQVVTESTLVDLSATPAVESRPSNTKQKVRESTVVNSSSTAVELGVSNARGATAFQKFIGSASVADTSVSAAVTTEIRSSERKYNETCEVTDTSSTDGSSDSGEPAPRPQGEDRKRKGIEAAEEHNEVAKQVGGSVSTKRSRAAEVHNLSERRRRDRINEKMKALQELIPRCNKSDKASMLDEAIEYLKSLQLQIQMMSMGCGGMVPMMYPGVHQFMPSMGMGMGMGMGMEMGMGMNRPMMAYHPNLVPGMTMPTQAAHFGPRFPMPAFPMQQPVHAPPDPSRSQPTGLPDSSVQSFNMQDANHLQAQNFTDPYQHYLSLHQRQLPLMQTQLSTHPTPSKLSTSKEPRKLDHGPSEGSSRAPTG